MAFDIVALGTSLGGVQALTRILADLPADFPVPLVVTQHIGHNPSYLVEILERITRLAVTWALPGEPLEAGKVYIAPPDQHLVISPEKHLTLSSRGPVNHSCPSVDVMFESVAEVYGRQAIGVVLTGMLYDGAKGAQAIHAAGGTVIVQDPQTAQAAGMPGAALQSGSVNFMVSLENIAATLVTMTMVKGAELIFSGRMPPQCYPPVSSRIFHR